MSAAVADLRLQVSRLLAADHRFDEAGAEIEAALAEPGLGEIAWRARQAYGELMYEQSRFLLAIAQWIAALQLAPQASAVSALCIARVLDGPRGHALARQLTSEQRASLAGLVSHPEGAFAVQLLGVRLSRLLGGSAHSSSGFPEVGLPVPPQGLDEPQAALLAQEYAEIGRVEEALDLVGEHPTDREAVAVRARLLLLAGRPAEAAAAVPDLSTPVSDGTVAAADQSLVATAALAALALGEADSAAQLVAPYLERLDVEPRMAAVVVALARQDYDGAEPVLKRLEALSGRSDDIRLLRLQLQLERGTVADLDAAVEPTRVLGGGTDPMWLRLQRSVRADDVPFQFVLAIRSEEPAVAADLLDGISRDWLSAGAPDRALDAARRAYAIDPRHRDTLVDALMGQSRALLDRPEPDHAVAATLAEEAWDLDHRETVAVLLVDAVVPPTQTLPGPEVVARLEPLLGTLAAQRATPDIANRLGWIHSRLGDVAELDRLDPTRRAAELFMAAVLVNPEDTFSWSQLSWSFTGLGAYGLGVRAASRAQALTPADVYTLSAAVANRLNRLGVDPEVPALLDEIERLEPEMHPWVEAVRLKVALVEGRAAEVERLLAGTLEELPWVVDTVAEAKLLAAASDASTAVDKSIEASSADGLLAAQARMELYVGRPERVRALLDEAARVRRERPRTVALVDVQARLVAGNPTAEADWNALLARSHQPGDLRGDLVVDVALLRRLVELDSPAARALDRIEEANRRRLAELLDRPLAVGEDLAEAGSASLVALATLWQAADRGAPWSELEAAASEVRALREELQPVAEAAADAVLDRSAGGRLDAISLRVDPTTGALDQLAGIEEWCGSLLDQTRRFQARSLHALHLLLTSPSSLPEAKNAAGLADDVSIDDMAGVWLQSIPDVENGWRCYERLESELVGDAWRQVGPAVLDRLTVLAGLGDTRPLDLPSSQSVGLGARFVPADRSLANWPLFSRDIPAIREEIPARTGVDIPGFHVREDPLTPDCLTYAVNDRPLALRADALADGEGDEDTDTVAARFLRNAAEAHLAELYGTGQVNEAAVTQRGLRDRLDDPAVVLAWLDAARTAIGRRRRIEPAVLAHALLTAPADEGVEAVLQRAVEVLPPWGAIGPDANADRDGDAR